MGQSQSSHRVEGVRQNAALQYGKWTVPKLEQYIAAMEKSPLYNERIAEAKLGCLRKATFVLTERKTAEAQTEDVDTKELRAQVKHIQRGPTGSLETLEDKVKELQRLNCKLSVKENTQTIGTESVPTPGEILEELSFLDFSAE